VRHAARPLGAGVRDAADRVPAAFARDIGPAVPARSAFLGGCADAKHSSGAACAAAASDDEAWTVGLAGGLIEGAPIRLAAEIARAVDDGDNLHVLPIVTRGATENVNSLLYLRGIDAAIINSDALDEYKRQVPDIQRRLVAELSRKITLKKTGLRKRLHKLDLAGDTLKRERRRYPKVLPKYRNPKKSPETWAGRGKQPRWLRAQLRSGKKLDDFRIGRSAAG
jgi:DNA-binding protein H-NS